MKEAQAVRVQGLSFEQWPLQGSDILWDFVAWNQFQFGDAGAAAVQSVA